MSRPETYTVELAQEIAPQLAEMFRNGESLAEVCAELGCCKESFYKMANICPQFSDAHKKGLGLSEAWWTKLGRDGATGEKPIQPATWVFNMKNRFQWADKFEHTGADGGPIKTENKNWTIEVVKPDAIDANP